MDKKLVILLLVAQLLLLASFILAASIEDAESGLGEALEGVEGSAGRVVSGLMSGSNGLVDTRTSARVATNVTLRC